MEWETTEIAMLNLGGTSMRFTIQYIPSCVEEPWRWKLGCSMCDTGFVHGGSKTLEEAKPDAVMAVRAAFQKGIRDLDSLDEESCSAQ